jgi:signal peptidase II
VRRHRIALGAGFASVLLCDQLTKSWAVATLWMRPEAQLVPGVLHLRLHFNEGVAFGLWRGGGVWLSLLGLGVAAIVLLAVRRMPGIGSRVAAGAVAGGIAGNALDRLLRQTPSLGPEPRRAVVDFIAVVPPHWPAFNVADAAIVLGGLALALALSRPR